MTDIKPETVAYADQRIASAAEFVDGMVAAIGEELASSPDSALETLALSELLLSCYQRSKSPPGITCDALALALRRLAAR